MQFIAYNSGMGWIESIIEKRGGLVSFAEYMEIALYHPEKGYYCGSEPRYGRHGDFLTAPTASPWYARVLARYLTRVASRGGPVTFVDLAAGDGSLLLGVAEALGQGRTDVLGRCVAVERSPSMQESLHRRLPFDFDLVDDLRKAERPTGPVVIHASELYDALPFERVVEGSNGLEELWVAVESGSLGWKQVPAREEVISYFFDHRVVLKPGQLAEACLTSKDTHRRHLQWADQDSLMLTLDYGYDSRRLYDPRGRSQGSLACYRRHQLTRDPLQFPGDQDITAHVNWDDLRVAARTEAWEEIGLWPLAEFLVRAGLAEVTEAHDLGMDAPMDARTISERQEIKRLLDPEGMGSDLKVLIQSSGALLDFSVPSL